MEPLTSARIATYNVRYFSHSVRGIASTHRSLEAIALALAPLHLDILCLQELRSEAQLVVLAESMRRSSGRTFHAHYFPAHRGRWYSTGLGLLLAARGVTATQVLSDEDTCGERRICAHARVGGVHVFNVHLSLPPLGTRLGHGANQLRQARRLRALIAQQAEDTPYVVCGDFNSLPSSPVAELFAQPAGVAPTAGLGPVHLRLDYMAGGNGIVWLDEEGTYAHGDKHGPFHGLSDHVPLIARVGGSENRTA